MASDAETGKPVISLRIDFAPGVRLGPGKADLLEGIAATGSIAAAGRRMDMSYKRAWLLVETMNAMFAGPLVISTKGGRAGGGAELTELGQQVLSRYRRAEAIIRSGAAADLAWLESVARKSG